MVANYYLSYGDIKQQRQAARGHYSTPYKNQILALHADNQVRRNLAERSDLTSFMTVVFANDTNAAVCEALAKNRRVSKGHVTTLGDKKKKASTKAANTLSPTKRCELAKQASSADQQLSFAKDSLAKVRLALIENRSLDNKTLSVLCNDRSKAVRIALAHRHGKNEICFEILGQDSLSEVKIALLQSRFGSVARSVPFRTLLHFAKDQDAYVRLAIVDNYRQFIYENDSKRNENDDPNINIDEEFELEKILSSDPNRDIRIKLVDISKFEEHQLRLCRDSEVSVREKLARRRTVPEKILLQLCDDGSESVRNLIASRRKNPQAVIDKLGSKSDHTAHIRMLKQGDGEFSDTLLMSMCQSENVKLRQVFAKTQGWKSSYFSILCADESESVRVELAGSRNLAFDQITVIFKDPSAKVRVACLDSFTTLKSSNQRAETGKNKSNAYDGLDYVGLISGLFYGHHHMPKEQNVSFSSEDEAKLETLMSIDRDDTVQEKLALICASSEVQKTLAQNKNESVRLNLAKNRFLSNEVSHQLATDESEIVRSRFSLKENLTQELCDVLISDSSRKVRRNLLNRNKLTKQQLMKLATDSDKNIRMRLAEQRADIPECFEILCKDDDAEVRIQLAYQHRLNYEQMTTLARDHSEQVRLVMLDTFVDYVIEQSEYDDEKLMEDQQKLDLSLLFSRDPSISIRAKVATRISDRKVQTILAKDVDEGIREALSSTARLDKKVLLLMCEDISDIVRINLAKRTSNNREIIDVLTRDANPKVRFSAYERNTGKKGLTAKNGLREKGKAELLERMRNDPDQRIQRLVKRTIV
jgi:hypothetical protein